MRYAIIRCLPAVVVSVLLAACGKAPAPSAQQGASASSSVASTPATRASGLPGDHASTRRYAIDITYPPLEPEAGPLTRAMHEHADAAKRQFLKALPAPDDKTPWADRQLRLIIQFSVASRTPGFLSARENGMMDTGGAHPMPLIGTFVFDRRAKKLVTLDDLFTDPVAMRKTLADYARKALYEKLLDKVPGGDKTAPKVRKEWQDNMRGMIDPGTEPTTQNFSRFLINGGGLDRPISLQLVFPPYQVAPYVYGVQTVDVPVKLFAAGLKPQYRPAFGLAP